MADNLKTTQDINKALQTKIGLIRSANKLMSRQVGIAREFCKAMDCDAKGSLQDMKRRIKEVDDALEDATEQAEDYNKEMKQFSGAVKGASMAAKLLSKAGKVLGFVFGGMVAGVRIATAIYKSFVNTAGRVYDEMLQVTKAAENVRHAFGDLTTGPGKDAMQLAKGLGRAFSEAGVGMGFGYAASAKIVEVAGEIMEGMGPALQLFTDMPARAQVQFAVMSKELGLVGEENQSLLRSFRSLGKDPVKAMGRVRGVAMQMRKAFGVSAKRIGKDIAHMSKNVGSFGGMTIKQMGLAAASMAEMGMSVKDLAGTAAAFDDFEKAAQTVSKFSMYFGTNLDLMGMMQEVDPSKRLMSIREEMHRVGKSTENMSRQERRAVADMLQMDIQSVDLALSTANRTLSQEELNKAMEGERDPMLQAADAMKNVAREMRSVINTLNDMGLASKGFFGAFATGVQQGLFRFGEFGKVSDKFGKTVKNLRRYGEQFATSLFATRDASGEATEELKIMDKIFAALEGAMDRIDAAFKKFSGEGGPLRAFFDALETGDPATIMSSMEEMGRNIVQSIKDVFALPETQKGVGEAFKGLFGALNNLFDKYIKPPIKDFASSAGEKLAEFFGPFVAGIALGTAAGILAPAMLVGGFGGFLGALAKIPAKVILKATVSGALIGVFITTTMMALGGGMVLFDRYVTSNLGDVDATTKAMGMLAEITLAMMPALLAAGALGLVLMQPQVAIGVLIGLAAGTATLLAFINAMGAGIMPVVEQIKDIANDIEDPVKFAAAGRVFVDVLEAVTKMGSLVADIIKATRPGIFATLLGRGSTMAENLDQTVEVIDAMLGTETTGMIGLVNTIVNAISSSGISVEQAQAAAAVASVIGAVAELMEAVSGPAEKLSTNMMLEGVMQMITGGEGSGATLSDQLGSMSDYMTTVMTGMGESMPALIVGIEEAISLIQNPEELETKGRALGVVFRALGDMMTALTENFQPGLATRMWASWSSFITGGSLPNRSAGEQAVMKLRDLASNMTVFLSGSELKNLYDQLKGANIPIISESQKTKLDGIASMFGAIGKMTTALTKTKPKKMRRILKRLVNVRVGQHLYNAVYHMNYWMGRAGKYNLTPLANKFASYTQAFEETIVPSTDVLADAMDLYSKKIPIIRRAIRNLGTIGIAAELHKSVTDAIFTSALDDGVTITGGSAEVTFNVTVYMDVAEVADAIADTHLFVER